MQLKKNNNIELYSFDIFDTVITRKTATPKGIFAIMQKELENNPDFNAEFRKNFYDIRIKSENSARKQAFMKSNCYEILFDDIYIYIKNKYSLSDVSTDFLKELELKCEAENIVGIDENICLIKDLINQKKRVILVSDMYYDSSTLRKFLSNIDSVFDDIKIYVSAENCASKSEGSLFRIVQKEENVCFNNWEHIGDNLFSDFKKSKKFGINAKLYNYPSLLPYEKDLIETYPSAADIQLIVGISKLTRLNNSQEKNKNKYDFGASFGGPVFYNYIMEVLETAISKGYKTLYFIARDGYIPKLVADIIIGEKGLPIKTKYIYGSRYAWRIPDEKIYDYFIEIMLDEYQFKISLDFLAYRLGISADTLSKFLPQIPKKGILKKEQLKEIQNSFIDNSSLKNLILTSYNERRQLLIEYLKQEIDFSEETIAFVEVNGSGRTQLFLSHYLNKITSCSACTFYITVSPDNIKDIIQQHVYSTRPRTYNTALELLCRTMYGQTMGYKQNEDGVVPIFDEFNKTALTEWGYEEYLQGLTDFVRNMIFYSSNTCSKEQYYAYFDYLNDKCDKETASILGDVPFALIGKENKIKKAAPKLSIFDLLTCFVFKKRILEISQYPYLSYARGNQVINNLKKLNKKLRNSSDYIVELKLLLLLKKLKDKKIVFWGASLFLEKFIKRWNINSNNIIAIVDKDIDRHGERYGKYTILSPTELNNLKPDYVIMTIKHRNEKIYKIISNTIENDYKFIKLIPNIFV